MATKAAQVESILAGFLDNSGNPLSGGKVYTYEAGTTTNKTTWQDKDKAATHANPIILDSQGQATVFADGLYKFVIRDSSDNLIETLDGIQYFFISSTITQATSIQAIDANGVSILDDGGNYGLIVDDGGNVGIGEDTNPQTQLGVAKQDSTAYSSTINITPTGSDVVRIRNTHSSAAWVGIQMEANSADPGIARLIVQKSGTDETDFHIQLKDADSPTNTVSQLSLTSEGDLTIGNSIIVGNATLSSGALESTVGNLSLNPVTGSAVVIDSHFSFDGTVLSALTDSNTTINAYAGRNITVESVTFDGGAVGGITTLAMTGALSGLTDISMSGTLDLGTNTILDGNFNGDWSFNSGNLSSVGTIGSGAITSTGVVQGTSITDGTATLSSGSLSGVVNITSSAGDIGITPVSGSAVILDSHFSFDGSILTALTASNTTINAYTGQNITIESVTFDGGVVGGISNLTMSGTLDIGTNTISDGNFNGNWSYNSGDLTGINSLTATNLTGTLQTASQTNITAVGDLTSLVVNGDITLNGNYPTGTDNTVVGAAAFSSALSGSNTCVVIGDDAVRGAATHGSAVIIGYQAANSGTVDSSVGIGRRALYSGGGGNRVVAIGINSQYSCTTGQYNIGLGAESLFSVTTTSNNIAIGYQSLYSTTGSGNLAVGHTAGSQITSGSENVIIGDYNGNEGGLDIRTSSNYMVFSDGDANIRAYCDNSGDWNMNGDVTAPNLYASSGTGSASSNRLAAIYIDTSGSTEATNTEYSFLRFSTPTYKSSGSSLAEGLEIGLSETDGLAYFTSNVNSGVTDYAIAIEQGTGYVNIGHQLGVGGLPDTTAHVYGNLKVERSNPGILFEETDGGGRQYGIRTTGVSTTDGIVFRDNSGANDLVLFKRNGTVQFNTYGAGDLQTDASGNISAVSDAYLKDSVSEYRKGLEDLKRLRQVEYFWKEDTGFDQSRKYQGWLAQEVEKVLPEAVHGKVGDDGNYIDGTRSLQTRPILAATVNAVCELDERLSRLERVVD